MGDATVRVIGTGSRSWEDVNKIRHEFDRLQLMHPWGVFLLAVGDARGADQLMAYVAHDKDWTVELWPADWKGSGRGAGFARNVQMVNRGGDYCVAFWDGKSSGTAHTFRLAKDRGIETILVEADHTITFPGRRAIPGSSTAHVRENDIVDQNGQEK